MIKYSSAPKGSNPCLAALVENIKTKEKFAVSTIRNPYGVYETTVCRAPNLWIAGLKACFSRFVFLVNSSTLQEAEQSHIRTAELFEQLNPKDLIKEYKIKGRIGLQLFVTNSDISVSNKSTIVLQRLLEDVQLGTAINIFETNSEWKEIVEPVKTLFNSGFSTEANERLFIKSSSTKDIVCGFVFGKLYKISVLQLTPNTDFYLKHFIDKYGKPKESNIDSDRRYLWEDNNTALELIAGRQPNILLTDKNLCKNSYKSNLKYQT